MKRLALFALLLAACGDSSDPLPSGPIVLTAEVRHVTPGDYTCEWRVIADAADLSDPATWMHGEVTYSGHEPAPMTPQGYWYPSRGIEPNEVLPGPWRGHGSTRAWTGRVTWVYESRGVTDSASATFDCD